MTWLLFYVFRQLFPAGSRGRFFLLASLLGVALGVAVLVVVLSVMNGFQSEIRRRMQSQFGQVRLLPEVSYADFQVLEHELLSHPDVFTFEPFWESPVLLELAGRYSFPLARALSQDRWQEPPFTLRLGSGIRSQLALPQGENVDVLLPEHLLEALHGAGELPLPSDFHVSEKPAAQESVVEMSWSDLESIFGPGERGQGLRLELKSGVDAELFALEFNGRPDKPPWRAISWVTAHGEWLSMLALEKASLFFSLVFIILVAAFAVASGLVLSVLRKTRELGLLLALGWTRRQVALAQILQALLLGIGGVFLGLGLAFLLLSLRDSLMAGLVHVLGDSLTRRHGVRHLPVEVHWGEVLGVSLLAISALCLAGFFAARRVLRLDASRALHHE